MKRFMLIALSAAVVSGCNSVPEKPVVSVAASEPETVEVAVAEVATVAVTVVEGELAQVGAAVEAAPAVEAEAAVPVQQPALKAAPAVVKAKPVATPIPVVTERAKALDPRMDKIVKLINTSSGARQVLASDNPKAQEYHAKAKALYDQALHATTKSDASRLLNKSVMAMYTAIRSASPGEVLAEKRKRDFDKLKRSVDTFIVQHKRISDEKGAGSSSDALRAQVDALVGEADKAFAAKQHGTAQKLLRESFEMLRNSIESMREGETLVRSLNFATKKDEYDYELERYKSQLLLVDVLLKEKRASSAYVAKQVDKYIAVAEEARGKAERAASDGDHKAAISLLEQARKQIVRALRTGGIYVPG